MVLRTLTAWSITWINLLIAVERFFRETFTVNKTNDILVNGQFSHISCDTWELIRSNSICQLRVQFEISVVSQTIRIQIISLFELSFKRSDHHAYGTKIEDFHLFHSPSLDLLRQWCSNIRNVCREFWDTSIEEVRPFAGRIRSNFVQNSVFSSIVHGIEAKRSKQNEKQEKKYDKQLRLYVINPTLCEADVVSDKFGCRIE